MIQVRIIPLLENSNRAKLNWKINPKAGTMKTIFIFIIAILTAHSIYSQTYFQKINDGAIVNTLTKGNISAWGDYDNDGYQDVVISVANDNCENCTYPLQLYKNNGEGFTRIYDNAIAQTSIVGSGSAWADYDNDGNLDLFVCGTNNSRNKLFHNDGNGNFTSVSEGIIVNDVLSWSQACAWADYDKDGLIDLFVANRDNERNFLYKNTGSGNFEKITEGSIVNDIGASRSCSWGDFDNDGWPDLFVLNYEGQNDYLYKNNGGESFTKITNLPMVNDNRWGNSCGWADFDNNGFPDLFVSNNSSNNSLFMNQGNGNFSLSNLEITMEGNSHGFTFGDYNNDGYEDLFVCNRNRHNTLYRNNEGASFTKITNEIISQEGGYSSIAPSMIDYDNDGSPDVFVTNRFSILYNYLYRNTNTINNSLTIRLKGCVSNRSAIGAKIRIVADGHQQVKYVTSGTGWGSQCSLWPHFGLGRATVIDSLFINWPSDSATILTGIDISVNRILTINECGSEVIGISNIVKNNLSFSLEQNYPNPFNPNTVISFSLNENRFVSLKVYDAAGKEIKTLVNELRPAGVYYTEFDGSGLSSGIYFYKLSAGDFISTKVMTLVK